VHLDRLAVLGFTGDEVLRDMLAGRAARRDGACEDGKKPRPHGTYV
jgi:hypothetical protein